MFSLTYFNDIVLDFCRDMFIFSIFIRTKLTYYVERFYKSSSRQQHVLPYKNDRPRINLASPCIVISDCIMETGMSNVQDTE